MTGFVRRYVRWLHTQWPAGTVEKLPVVGEDGSTNIPGLSIVGDLTGVPLLKLASDSGARAVERILADPGFRNRPRERGVLDLVIVGAGVSGVAAAAAAKRAGLAFEIIEAKRPFDTVHNFPRAKPIYTYPSEMEPEGELRFSERSNVKEGLVEELEEFRVERGIEPRLAHAERVVRRGGQLDVHCSDGERLRAHRVIVAIGRSGNFRTLGVKGEDLDKVTNRLHDPKDFAGKNVLVVGGGDSALEAAIALAQCGAAVTLSYRRSAFSRAKPANVEALERLARDPFADVSVEHPTSERVTTAAGGFLGRARRPGSIRLAMSSEVREIRERSVLLAHGGGREEEIPNDTVFAMIGREAPLDFFRRSGVRVRGEWSVRSLIGLAAFFLFCLALYHWKSHAGPDLQGWFERYGLFPFNLTNPANPASLFGTLRLSMHEPAFWYSLAYTVCVVLFGIRRIRRRRTPYVTRQTATLAAIQVVPLFLLPFVLLPWAGHNGFFDGGAGRSVADALFPETTWAVHGREYWRAVGFILAWPLLIWNVFTHEPLWWWLAISFVQTFVLIPLMVWRWGKGAYCGWICSCGALAETLGDAHRHKMPHGPVWNRLNLVGQVFLLCAFVLLVLRIAAWIWPASGAASLFTAGLQGTGGFPLNLLSYQWFVDLFWAGVLGVAFYFWLSGRIWCRFACPLAALMHIYARFSRFRILAEKSKCISCNVCTSVCHQGIDVMNFANKGLPMEDPQCVRCSACVQSCPTGVLSFGAIDRTTGEIIARDRLVASPLRTAEAS